MKTNTRFITVLFCLYFSFSSAQENKKIDSLLQLYRTLPIDTTKINLIDHIFSYYIFNDPTKALAFAKERNAISKKIGHKKGVGQSFLNYAFYYNQIGKLDSSKIYNKKALALFEDINFIDGQSSARRAIAWDLLSEEGGTEKALKMHDSNIDFFKQTKDSLRLGYTYESQARLHMSKGNYKISLLKCIEALKIFEKENKVLRIADAYRVMATNHCELRNDEQALKYALKALRIYEERNDTKFIGNTLNTMGIIYDYMDDFQNADLSYERALLISKELGIPSDQQLALINHSRSYEKRKDYASAMIKLQAYLEIDANSQSKNRSSLGLLGMGSILVNSNRAKEGKEYLDRALVFAKKENEKSRLNLAYLNRAKAHAKLNDFRKAYEDYQMYAVYKDSMYNETKSQQIEEMRAIFETEKKEQQIVLQENEIDLLEQEAEISNLQRMLLGGGLGLSVLLAGFGFYGFRQKIKRNKLEKEKVDTELAFKKKELTTHAMHLAKKNEVLEHVKQKAKELKTSENGGRGYQQLIQTINFDQQDDKNWENFTQYFEQVHKDFSKTVKNKYPEVSKNELRLMALLKMNLSSKEIATILNISSDGIKKARQRLRKKMQLSPEESLEATVLTI